MAGMVFGWLASGRTAIVGLVWKGEGEAIQFYEAAALTLPHTATKTRFGRCGFAAADAHWSGKR